MLYQVKGKVLINKFFQLVLRGKPANLFGKGENRKLQQKGAALIRTRGIASGIHGESASSTVVQLIKQ